MQRSRTLRLLIGAWVLLAGAILFGVIQSASAERAKRAREFDRYTALPVIADAVSPQADSPNARTPISERGDSTLPAVFFGDTALHGRVLDDAGQPIAGAVVQCVPNGFTLFSQRAQEVFSTRTDAAGDFAFDRLPSVRACYLQSRAASGVSRKVALRQPFGHVTLVVAPIRYALVDFVDSSGRAVSIRGRRLPFAGVLDQLLYVSAMEFGTLHRNEALPLFGEGADLREDQALFVLRGGPHSFGWDIKVAGYRGRSVRVRTFPADAWPTSQACALEPTAESQRTYRVTLPRIDPPKGWGMGAARHYRPLLHVYFADTSGREVAAPFFEPFLRFETNRELPVRVTLGTRFELEHSVQQNRNELLIAPSYPRFGFLELSFDVKSLPAGPLLDEWEFAAAQPDSAAAFAGTRVYPGLVRFGPLPEGSYSVFLRGAGEEQPIVWGPFQIRGNSQVTHAEWR